MGSGCSRIGYCRRYLGLQGRKKLEELVKWNFTIFIPHGMLFRTSNQSEWDGWSKWHIRGSGGAYKVLVRKPEGKKTLVGRLQHRHDDFEIYLQETQYIGVGTKLIWLSSGTSGGASK
jgi:hypothetical protein